MCLIMHTKLNPETVIGQKYEKGMLPYGGRVNCQGEVAFVVSKEEFEEKMSRLESIR